MVNPMTSSQKFLTDYPRWSHAWLYSGDLETDFLRILGQIRKSAEDKPAEIGMNFRKG